MIVRSESPRSGGIMNFLKLTKFRGQDYGKSQFREQDQEIEQIQFNGITTLRAIFQPLQMTQSGASYMNPTSMQTLRALKKQQPPDSKDQGAKRAQSGQKEAGQNQKVEDKSSFNQEISGQLAQQSSRNQASNQKTPNVKLPKEIQQNNVLSPPPEKDTNQQITSQTSAANNSRVTAVGELVYQRQPIDFKYINKNTKRDFVLEDNLLDVKKLLKTSSFIDKNSQNQTDPEKKQLLRVNLEPFYTATSPDDTTLIFESRFESGNLAAAVKVKEDDYHLLLQNDVNTSGHTQWFFFRVHNVKVGEVRFNMLNLCKPDSLYNEGMKILVYSERIAALKDIGWHRAGTKISYYQNSIRKGDSKVGNMRFYYTHTFTYNFEQANDTVYFAYCYPYTYTDMLEDLSKIMQDPQKASFCKRQTLCDSLAGNKVEMLTITSRSNPETMSKRRGIVLTSRVHPGESVGSWVMKGVLNFLTNTEDPSAELLRQNFVFKILPMLNPDGVINGNYRCSLAGCDLNRRWKAPSKILHPSIYATKQMILQFAKEREFYLYCDFHGHSRRKNIFMYGCSVPASPEDTRIFPFILGSICPFFIYSYSRFGNQKSKEATARMALFNELKTPNIYTLEASFQGNDCGQFKNYHFSTENLMQTGEDFCRSLLIFATIQCPNRIMDDLLRNINGIYNHYKTVNDNLQNFEKDPDVQLMKIYKDKIADLQDKNIPINTNQVKKALLKVLRQHQDVQTDGDNTSDAGSDNAPSEDNSQPEEISDIVPIIEESASKKKKKQEVAQAQLSGSPLKRRVTIKEQKIEAQKTLKINPTKVSKPSGKKKDGDSGRDEKKSDTEKEKEEQITMQSANKKEQEIGPELVTEENVVHKKKLKKNVESRDACTQTDRSDYMLIKQRQKQKEIIQLAKQGQLPPGITPQQLVQSFIQIQPNQQQLIQIDPQRTLGKTQGHLIAGALANTNQNQQQQLNSNQQRVAVANNSQVFSNPHLQQTQPASNFTSKLARHTQQQNSFVDFTQPRIVQELDYSQNSAFLPSDVPDQANSVYLNNVTNWLSQSAMRQVHQSYSPQKQRKVLSGQIQTDQKAVTNVPLLNSGQTIPENHQRSAVSQHGPRTTSLGQTVNQPFDQSKNNWEHAIQQQKVTNAAINQWIQMKNKEQMQALNQMHPEQMHQPQIMNRSMNSNATKVSQNLANKNLNSSLVNEKSSIVNVNTSQKMNAQPNISLHHKTQSQVNSRAASKATVSFNQQYADGLPNIMVQSPPKPKKAQKFNYKGPSFNISNLGDSRESLPGQLRESVEFQKHSKSSLNPTNTLESQKRIQMKVQAPNLDEPQRSLNQSQITQNQTRQSRQGQGLNAFSHESLSKAVNYAVPEQVGFQRQNDKESLEPSYQARQFAVLENQFIKQTLEQQQIVQQMGVSGSSQYRKQHQINEHSQAVSSQDAYIKQAPESQKMYAQQVSQKPFQNINTTPNKNSRPQGSGANSQMNMTRNEKQFAAQKPQSIKGVQATHIMHNTAPSSQFFHVQRMVPQNQEGYHGSVPQNHNESANKGVKINIVNVHNEFNIQNNIIIQQTAKSEPDQQDKNNQKKAKKSNQPTAQQAKRQ